jgi:radical SAM superfamily enzyme YgiQ (UPF0313 family)
MKLGLLAMSGVRVRNERLAWLGVTLPQFVSRGHVIASLPSLPLLTLAALTPSEIEVEYVEIPHIDDLNIESLPDFDAVAISSYSAQIYEAYRLADTLRERGVKTIIGGPHVSALPDEASRHVDCVVVGEGEPLWPEIARDLLAGNLKRVYRSSAPGTYDLADAPIPRFDLLDPENYNRIAIQTSRGCPRNCDFCAGSKLLGPGFRQKPVANVVREIEALMDIWERPFIEFADDNTFVDKKWSRKLIEAVEPLGIKWFAETDISVADDDELLSRLRGAGCYQLLIGLETLSSKTLSNVEQTGWKARQVSRYAEQVRKIQSHGVTVNACFVVGFDGEGVEVFEQIRQFEKEAEPLEIQVTVLTPFPGTPIFQSLAREGRLDAIPFWDRCTLFDLNFQPRGMSRGELENGLYDLFSAMYCEEEFLRRKRRYMELCRELKRRKAAEKGAMA